MLLSICIPTYNRAACLKKTLNIWATQIHEGNYVDAIEINISDNGSPDNTQDVILAFKTENPDVKVSCLRNNENLGPDKNYLRAMHMAHGDFSILWSDDDYLRDGALRYIFETIKQNPDINFFISNRTIWRDGEEIGYQTFLHPDISTRVFDFNNQDQALLYFSSVISLGGLFSYIPAVIYKSDIGKMYNYDGCLDGTYYSFLFYWWQYLLEGNKLMYLNTSYINCTLDFNNNNFGKNINRTLVDYEGYIKVADCLGLKGVLRSYFLRCVNTDHSFMQFVDHCILSKDVFTSRLVPAMKKCGVTQRYIEEVVRCSKRRTGIRNIILSIVPHIYALRSH